MILICQMDQSEHLDEKKKKSKINFDHNITNSQKWFVCASVFLA